MADGPALAWQAALVAYLRADAGVSALVGARVYDEPPSDALRPLVRLGPMIVTPLRSDARAAFQIDFGVEGHSRPTAGRVEAQRIAEACRAALDERHAEIAVAGFRLAWVQFTTATTIRNADGRSYQSNAGFVAALDVPV